MQVRANLSGARSELSWRVFTPSLQASRCRSPFIYPRFRRLPPPLIVVGMHRSGTSLVAAMLSALGVFMGPQDTAGEAADGPEGCHFLNGYAEAHDFHSLNELALARAGATWDQVEPFLKSRDRPGFAWANTASFQLATFGPLQRHYLRPVPAGFRGPWGWKDPRNSLTLPYWLRLFPQARILHVRRDTEAVIDSLRRRAREWQSSPDLPLPPVQRLQVWMRHPGRTLQRAGRRFGVLPPAPVAPDLNREYCQSLCRQYVEECQRYRHRGDRYLELEYEEVLDDPLRAARTLAQFAGGEASRQNWLQAAALVRRERKADEPSRSAAEPVEPPARNELPAERTSARVIR